MDRSNVSPATGVKLFNVTVREPPKAAFPVVLRAPYWVPRVVPLEAKAERPGGIEHDAAELVVPPFTFNGPMFAERASRDRAAVDVHFTERAGRVGVWHVVVHTTNLSAHFVSPA